MNDSLSEAECDTDEKALCEANCSLPSVTVIVPVRNEEQHIAHTLDQLLAQERQGIHAEILVVDGSSTDETPEFLQ
jgi:glycosyltransferase involved in cell wall biosynthesis